MSCDTWWGVDILLWYRQCLEDSEQKDDSTNYSIDECMYKGVYRTAPATPGLLIIEEGGCY